MLERASRFLSVERLHARAFGARIRLLLEVEIPLSL